jgi:hypothetical protein
MGELADRPAESFSLEYVFLLSCSRLLTDRLVRERREHRVFTHLLEMVPGLEERLLEGSEEGVVHVAELVCGICISYFCTN